ncbi:MAG: prenyltransferase/squalene oxidase repeat-containing protein [Planctomycetota bacterium]
MNYATELATRFAMAGAHLPEELRRRTLDYVIAQQRPDGGFAGRQGESDPYYTSFAVRTLAAIGGFDDARAARADGWFSDQLLRGFGPLDCLSLLAIAPILELVLGDECAGGRFDSASALAALAGDLARNDGCYAKTARSGPSSTYMTYLMLLAMQSENVPVLEPGKLAACIAARQRDDGGFAELDVIRRSGTNPTAAAVGVLRALDVLTEPQALAAARFLEGMQHGGGLRAAAVAPTPDLLSTMTALVAQADLKVDCRLDTAALREYVAALEAPGGGFRGGTWDDTPDVEYTFYGTLALGMLEMGDAQS